MTPTPFDNWLALRTTDPQGAHLALVHAAAYYEYLSDKITVDELFTRALAWYHQPATMVTAPWKVTA